MYDLIVVGLGIYGSTVVNTAAEQGLSVLGIDKYSLGHAYGSSHGSSRIFRLTTVEGDEYAILAKESDKTWKAYNDAMNGELIVPTGFALISSANTANQKHHGVKDLLGQAKAVATMRSIDHKVLSGSDFSNNFSSINIPASSEIYLESEAYILRPGNVLQYIHNNIANYENVEIRTGQEAKNIEILPDGTIQIDVAGDIVSARHVILCTGPWQHSTLLGENIIDAKVSPQVTLTLPQSSSSDLIGLPGFVELEADGPLVYVVPPTKDLLELKVGIEQEECIIDSPDNFPQKELFVEESIEKITAAVSRVLPDVDLTNARADLCYYTITPESKHIVAKPKDYPGVTVISACSGHGFKYAPAIASRVIAGILAETTLLDQ